MLEYELDNELQKIGGQLWSMTNEGIANHDYAKLEAALAILSFLKSFWIAASYGYKGREIADRIDDYCYGRMADLHHRATAQMLMLKDLAGIASALRKEFNLMPIR